MPGRGLGIASLVLGILGILTFWFAGLGGVLGLVGLILGIIGVVKIRKSRRGSPALAVVGIVLSALALLGGILMAVLFAWVFGQAADCMDLAVAGNDAAYQECVQNALNDSLNS